MSYQALYRKYRSQRFDEMIGQEVVATTLKNAIVNQQISHAYLFSGPRGTGKTSAAKIFAKAINCLHPENGEPDNTCDICQAITAGALNDVIELDAASNNGVDEIREIRDKSTYAAAQATYKVYIIDEVHMLSTGAFNALLKTLEEPTENVVFILATTELQKIPATIISRVQRFAFKAITTADIRQHLTTVLAEEKVDFEPEALDVIAKSAEGGMRDALSLLDQALSFSEGKLRETDALLVTGSIAADALITYVQALAQSDEKAALIELDKIFDEGKNMLRFTEDLLAYFRDLLLSEQNEIPHATLFHWIDIAIESLKTLRETTQTKIAADVMTLRMTEPQVSQASRVADKATASPVPRQTPTVSMPNPVTKSNPVAMPEPSPKSAPDVMPEPTPKSSPAPEPIPLSKAPAPGKSASAGHSAVGRSRISAILASATSEAIGTVKDAWEEIARSMVSPSDRALVKNATPVAASEESLILTVSHSNLAGIFMKKEQLLLQINNLLASITQLTPEILVLSVDDWKQARADFVKQRNGEGVVHLESESQETGSVEVPVAAARATEPQFVENQMAEVQVATPRREDAQSLDFLEPLPPEPAGFESEPPAQAPVAPVDPADFLDKARKLFGDKVVEI